MENDRESFRIEDEIQLQFDILTPESKNQNSKNKALFNTLTMMHRLDRENLLVLEKIKKTNYDVGRYLDTLNQKINLITHANMASDDMPLKKVNISATGMAFENNASLAQDTPLAMRFVLLPDYYGIMCQATVVNSRENNGKYEIAVQFDNLSDMDDQMLTRHLFQKQTKARRNELNSDE